MTEFINLKPVQIAREWVRNESIAVTTTSIELAPTRSRVMILVRNNSAVGTDILTINVGGLPAVAGVGIILKQGESFSDSDETGYLSYQGTYTIIGNSATNVAVVVER